jgi:DNA polymerase-3 subunit alpha
MGLFVPPDKPIHDESYQFSNTVTWSSREILEKEKEVIGFYLSAHPLETYRHYINWFAPQPFQAVRTAASSHRGEQEYLALVCGLLKSRKDIITKKGDRMAFLQLEDGETTIEVVLFPKTFATCESWLTDYHVFLISGAVDTTDAKTLKIKANKCIPMELVLQEWQPIQYAVLELPHPIHEQLIDTVAKTLIPGPIATYMIFHDQGKKLRLSLKQKIALDEGILHTLIGMGINVKIAV